MLPLLIPPLAQAAKAIEAAQGASTPTPTSSRPPSLATSSIWSLRIVERRRPRDAGPAPPDYGQATAWRSAFAPPPFEASEALDAAEDDPLISGLDLAKGRKLDYRASVKRHWKSLCLLNLAIYCLLATIAIVIQARVKAPAAQQLYALEYLESVQDAARYHPNTSLCQFHHRSGYQVFSFGDPRDFSLVEAIQPDAEYDLEGYTISGSIVVRPAPYRQRGAAEIFVSEAWSEQWRSRVGWYPQEGNNSLRLRPPYPPRAVLTSQAEGTRPKGEHGTGRACLDLRVVVYVKTTLEDFEIEAERLNIDLGGRNTAGPNHARQGYSFQVHNHTRLHTVRGNVTINRLDSRTASISSEKGNILGTYALNDGLTLSTDTGDIQATMDHMGVSVDGIPRYMPSITPAYLHTTTHSGAQKIHLQPMVGLFGPNPPEWEEQYLLNMSHTSRSGRVELSLLSPWEGRIVAETVTGNISMRGKDLRPVLGLDGGVAIQPQPRRVEAKKGMMEGRIVATTEGGDVDICIDDDCPTAWLGELEVTLAQNR